jgi:DNA-binding transcriptional LysR family regulator
MRGGLTRARPPAPFRVAASDYLDPLFLPQLVARIKAQAPLCPIEILPLSADAHYHAHLAQGDVDVVIGNWPQPPDDLHMGRLFGDEVVCLVSTRTTPPCAAAGTLETWLAAEHIAPTPTHPGAKGVIDDHLESLGLSRNITARCPHFGLIPAMVASSLLVLTTGRQYCERFLDSCRSKYLNVPSSFRLCLYYQLWHERTHASASAKWLRERVKTVAAGLSTKGKARVISQEAPGMPS